MQLPFFIGLYWVIIESVELRHAPFIGWIQDLSSKDPYYILPLLMLVTMVIQQKLSPAPADPVQAKVMMFMPVVFSALFINFPAGLLIYWVVNNTVSILQQWYVNKTHPVAQ
jgi:YidC/Oxa1 family membrane protein insertase